MAKGFFKGLALGTVAAAAGYIYYKSLSEQERADLKAKADGYYGDAKTQAKSYKAKAQEEVNKYAEITGLADNEELQAKLADLKIKSDELKAQAKELIADAKVKAEEQAADFKAKVAPEVAEEDIDIVLDADAPTLKEAFEELDAEDVVAAASEAVEPVVTEVAESVADIKGSAAGVAKAVAKEVASEAEGLSESKKSGLSGL